LKRRSGRNRGWVCSSNRWSAWDPSPEGLDWVFGEEEAQNIVQILDGIRRCAFG
jgi:hypothetical protein